MTWQGPDTDATREGSLCSHSNGMLNSVPKGQLPALNRSSFCLQSQRPRFLSLPALLVHKLLIRGGRPSGTSRTPPVAGVARRRDWAGLIPQLPRPCSLPANAAPFFAPTWGCNARLPPTPPSPAPLGLGPAPSSPRVVLGD